jgi:hypothetical protein
MASVETEAGGGFHEGELSVQRRAGVASEAARLEGMLDPPRLSGGASRFLADRDLAVLTARDRAGRLWISPLTGRPGFLTVHDDTLRVDARPSPADPLADLPAGGKAGLVVVDFATRRRFRVNGTLTVTDRQGFEVDVAEAFGNCPQYIQQRHLDDASAEPVPASEDGGARAPQAGPRLTDRMDAGQAALVGRADTFFLGTSHPVRGADASHRGGPPGFVRVEGDGLWWPDYPGNNMFNSLGNLAVDDTAALLFLDFATGRTLQLSGTAAVDWTDRGTPGDDGRTGRRVRFGPRLVAAGHTALHAGPAVPSRYNPGLT